MGSSSKNRGGGFQDPNAGRKPDATMTKGLGPKGGTNAYYSNPSMVPAAGGLVRPDALPGGIPGGIGLNFVKPQRDQLAGMMSPTAHVSYGPNGQPVVSDPFWKDPYRQHRYEGSGSHGGGRG